jgi:hypothetical protein
MHERQHHPRFRHRRYHVQPAAAGNKKLHLIGVSMGGMISQEYASQFPDVIKSLTLVNTHSGHGVYSQVPLRGLSTILRWTLLRLLPMRIHSRADAAMELLYGNSDPKPAAKWTALVNSNYDRIRATSRQTKGGLVAHTTVVARHHLNAKRLRALAAVGYPILCIVGTRDIVIRPNNSFYLRSLLGCSLHVFRGAGHGVIGEASDAVNAILVQHFDAAERNEQRTPTIHFHGRDQEVKMLLQQRKKHWRTMQRRMLYWVLGLASAACMLRSWYTMLVRVRRQSSASSSSMRVRALGVVFVRGLLAPLRVLMRFVVRAFWALRALAAYARRTAGI